MDSSDSVTIENVAVKTVMPTVFETVDAPTLIQHSEPHSESKQTLKALRTLRKFSQQTLAKSMGTSQGEISRIEKRKDMHITTLRSYIRSIGGEVVILAKFPDDQVIQVTI